MEMPSKWHKWFISNQNTTSKHTKQTRTFAQALSNLCDIPTSQLPQPILKGDNFAITILMRNMLLVFEACKHNCMLESFGQRVPPLSLFLNYDQSYQLCERTLTKWGIQSLGKGYTMNSLLLV